MSFHGECKAKERYLGVTETSLHLCHKMQQPVCIIHSANIISSLEVVDESLVKKAFLSLCSKHTLLDSHIVADTDGNYKYQPLRNDLKNDQMMWPPVQFLEGGHKDDWKDFIPQLTKMGFHENMPLWRATWLKVKNSEEDGFTNVLIFTAHHGIIDAKCMFDLINNQFLPILNDLAKGYDDFSSYLSPIKFLKSSDAVFMGIEQPLSKVNSKWYLDILLKFVVWSSKRFGKSIEDSNLTLNVGKYINIERNHIHPFQLSKSFTDMLIKWCKKSNVTVNSVIMSALGAAISETSGLKKKLNLFCSVDCRRFYDELSQSPMPLGCFVTSANVPMSKKAYFQFSNVHKNALTIQGQVHSQVRPDSINKSFVLAFSRLFTRKNNPNMLHILHALGRVNSIYVSNIGVQTDVKHSRSNNVYKLKEHYFLADGLALNLFLTCVTYKEKMFFCLCGNQHWMDIALIKRISSKFIDILKGNLNNNDSSQSS